MAINLAGLHIWVTRPSAQAMPWAAELEKLGAKALIEPCLAIQPVSLAADTQAITNKLLRLDEYHKAIFVSQNAVEYGVEWIDRYWPQLPAQLRFFAIGASTAKLLSLKLSEIDVTVAAAQESMNSEALLTLPSLQNIENEKILIFRGKGGRTHLGKSLEARGALIDYCELYERVCPSHIDEARLSEWLKSKLCTVISVHSGETLENLHSMVNQQALDWIKQQALLLPGQRVADIARTLGFTNLIIAANATHESMIGALHDWRQERQQ